MCFWKAYYLSELFLHVLVLLMVLVGEVICKYKACIYFSDQCPLGEEMGPGGTSPADCVSCEVGTYKDASKPTCQPCPDGYITDTSGSTSSTECKRKFGL